MIMTLEYEIFTVHGTVPHCHAEHFFALTPPSLPSTCIIPILPTRICAGAAPCCYLYRIQTNWIVCTCVTLNILSDRESQWISEACWRTKSQSKWTHLCILYMKHISQLCAQRRAVGRVQKCRLAYSPDSWAEQSITPPMPEASGTKLKVTQTPLGVKEGVFYVKLLVIVANDSFGRVRFVGVQARFFSNPGGPVSLSRP